MIRVYGIAASRALRVLWMLEELDVAYEHVKTNFATGDTRSAEFLKLNPNGHIPVLVDGATVLWESMAINLYLARRYGAGTLWPAAIEDEGRLFQWSFWGMTELEPALLPILMHRRILPAAQRDAAIAANAEAKLAAPLTVLEGALRDRPCLLGNAFTAADLNVSVVLAWAVLVGLDLQRWPQTAAWLQRYLDRPAFKTARST